MRVKTTGGKKLQRFITDTKRNIARVDNAVVEVGFVNDRIAPLAALHEFGSSKTNLPERPAFRASLSSGAGRHAGVYPEAQGREVDGCTSRAGNCWA